MGSDAPEISKWPEEIFLAELDEHHNGTGMVVLSEFATVPRWEGDDERDCEFQRYVDADIHDSAEKYWKHQVETLRKCLADTRHEICMGPRDDTLWHTAKPACTTVDNITLTLGDNWSYDDWLANHK